MNQTFAVTLYKSHAQSWFGDCCVKGQRGAGILFSKKNKKHRREAVLLVALWGQDRSVRAWERDRRAYTARAQARPTAPWNRLPGMEAAAARPLPSHREA